MRTSNKYPISIILITFIGLTACLKADGMLDFNFITPKSDLQLTIDNNELQANLPGDEKIEIVGAPRLPCKVVKIALPSGTTVGRIEAVPAQITLIGRYDDHAAYPGDIKTDGLSSGNGATGKNEAIYGSDAQFPGNYFDLIDKGIFGNQEILTVRLNPVQYRPLSGELYLAGEIKLKIHLIEASLSGPAVHIGARQLRRMVINPEQIDIDNRETTNDTPVLCRQGNLGIGAEYLVITNAEMAPAFYPWVFWKNQKGITAEIALIDDILSNYPGVDNAAKLRTYLQQAFTAGARWVLLGGDEDVIPIRYAFPGNVSYPITLNNQQICDLYYGDLSGDWDYDNDGVYGEMSHDRPDLYPEIYVGRVPANRPEEVANWVRKALIYEQNPGNGDYSYLSRALFITADQMRDLNEHISLAGIMPGHFNVDYSRCAEEPSGSSDSPIQPTAQRVLEVINEGWGYIGNLNHGNVSSYVTMAPNYNYAPRSYLWGDSVVQQDGAATILWQDSTTKFSIKYSISCDNAAFDFDKEVFRPGPFLTNSTFMEPFLFLPDRGGVGYLGNTRWGWVSASYRMELKFLEYLYNDSSCQLGVAEALSKIYYPSYRDICYGHNLFGDPEMAVWKYPPRPLFVSAPQSITPDSQSLSVTVATADGPAGGVKVCVWKPGEFMFRGTTNGSGEILVPLAVADPGLMFVTATGRDLVPDIDTVVVLARAGIDDQALLPDEMKLDHNYPNPFNSSTKIRFALGSPQKAILEIFDLSGRKVKTIAEKEYPAGTHSIEWNGQTEDGSPAASGLYMYALKAGQNRAVGKMLLLK